MEKLKIEFEDDIKGQALSEILITQGSHPTGLIVESVNDIGEQDFLAMDVGLRVMIGDTSLPNLKQKLRALFKQKEMDRLQKLGQIPNKCWTKTMGRKK